jgi:RES domain-containing protein
LSAEVELWRIAPDTPDYEAHDLSGKGAEETGGRWNRKRTPLVYTSISRALACLETIVHLSSSGVLPLNRYLVQIRVPMTLWDVRVVFDPAHHVGWDAEPAGKVSMDWGTAWAQGGTTLLAEVPSLIVPEEQNILINPNHPDAAQVAAIKVRKWTYDPRLG